MGSSGVGRRFAYAVIPPCGCGEKCTKNIFRGLGFESAFAGTKLDFRFWFGYAQSLKWL